MGYFLYKEVKEKKQDVLKRVPQDAMFFYTGKYKRSDKDLLSKKMETLRLLFSSSPNFLKNEMKSIGLFNSFLVPYLKGENYKFSMSLHHADNEEKGVFLFSLELSSKEVEEMREMLKNLGLKKHKDFYRLKLVDRYLYFFLSDEGVWLSTNTKILQRSFNPDIDNLENEKTFLELYNLNETGDNLATVYINYKKTKMMGSLLASPYIKGLLSEVKLESDWIMLDLDATDSKLLATGFINRPYRRKSYFQMFKNQKTVEPTLMDIVPYNTNYFYYENVSSPSIFYKELKNFSTNLYKELEHDNIVPFLGSQRAVLITHSDVKTIHDSRIFIFESSNVEKLDSIFSSSLSSEKETYKSFKIDRFDFKSHIPKSISYNFFTDTLATHYTIVDMFFVISTKSGLKRYIDGLSTSKSLTDNPKFNLLSQDFLLEAPIFIYCDLDNKSELVEELADKEAFISPLMNSLGSFGAQLSFETTKLIILNIVYLQPNLEGKAIKKLSLADNINTAVTLAKNHKTGKENFIFQDKKNNLYLIDEKFDSIWEKKLDGKILGKIHQVDAFDNNKLQFFFNTKTHLYLLDINGNNVDGFPKKFKLDVISGVNLMDYENNKNYRALIFGLDNFLYNYTVMGNQIKGWLYKPLSTSTSQILYTSYAQKDYILTLSSSGKVRAVKRNGELRKQYHKKFPKGTDKYFIEADKPDILQAFNTINNSWYNLSVSKDNIDSITFTSSQELTYHSNTKFKGSTALIISDSTSISILNYNKDTLFTHSIEERVSRENDVKVIEGINSPFLVYLEKGKKLRIINMLTPSLDEKLVELKYFPDKWWILKTDEKRDKYAFVYSYQSSLYFKNIEI